MESGRDNSKPGAKAKPQVRNSSHKSDKKKAVAKGTSQRAKRARQLAFMKAFVAKENNFNATTVCNKVGLSRRTFEKWCTDDLGFSEEFRGLIEHIDDFYEEFLFKNARAGDSASIIFYLKTRGRKRGYVERDHATDAKENAILDEFSGGTLTALEAAVKIHKLGRALPKVLELQLAKNEAPKPPDDRPPLTSEELDRRYEESLLIADGQRNGTLTGDHFSLPGRQEEIRKLKEEMKKLEQFGPNTEEE